MSQESLESSHSNVGENNIRVPDNNEVITQRKHGMLYTISDVPPWYLSIILGFQHYLTSVGGNIATLMLLARPLCLEGDSVGHGEVMNTLFFVSGVGTFLQTTFGVRLPIVQGSSGAFLVPIFVMMAQSHWECPYWNLDKMNGNSSNLPELGSEEHKVIWKGRLCQVQGALIVAALFQVVVGFSGLLGLILRYIGPLTIAPTISLIGLSLAKEIAGLASLHWYIALMTVFVITLFSQYLGNVAVPLCRYETKRGCSLFRLQIFKLFPILLAIVASWTVCGILTATGALPDDKNEWGYQARTDLKLNAVGASKWFRVPYPGQWGLPTVTPEGVLGMIAGVVAAMVESVGDYYACAKISGAKRPPAFAINRGSGMEGLILIICGAFGCGPGLTSYSENIGAIGITKVGSRRVVQTGGLIMIILGCIGKFGAIFVSIPDPIIGGVLIVSLGMVISVGISNLQSVDLSSNRNMFILGMAYFFGLCLPLWLRDNPDAINTGNATANNILTILCSTSMFVGGLTGMILDNTIPGTLEERGMSHCESSEPESEEHNKEISVQNTYHIPYIDNYLKSFHLAQYIPFCSHFKPSNYCTFRKKKDYKSKPECNIIGTNDIEEGCKMTEFNKM